jgi:GNAT superfamily N-acetyltransferase
MLSKIKNKYMPETFPATPEQQPPAHGAELTATWRTIPEWQDHYQDPDVGVIEVALPGAEAGKNKLECSLVTQEEDRSIKMAFVESVNIDENLRGRGIGSSMYRILARTALKHGATHLGGTNTTPAALTARLRVFGQERLTFYDKAPGDLDEVVSMKKPLDPEEAHARVAAKAQEQEYYDSLRAKYTKPGESSEDYLLVDRATTEELATMNDLYEASKQYYAVIDLRGLDTTGWNRLFATEQFVLGG